MKSNYYGPPERLDSSDNYLTGELLCITCDRSYDLGTAMLHQAKEKAEVKLEAMERAADSK
jgi:hypothetical protein